ncbi:peptidoglycan DD-metalloendopeptidase family protein [Vibrio sp. AK197]
MNKSLQSKTLLMASIALSLTGCAVHSPAPVSGLHKDYDSVPRGSYRGSYYEVKKGDTLYFIAYITDKDVNDLIRYNHLQKPYTIYPGQKLNLWRPVYTPPSYGGTGAGAEVGAVASTVKPSVAASKPIVSSPSSSSSAASLNKNSSQGVSTKPLSPAQKLSKKDAEKRVEQSKSKEYVDSAGKRNVNKTASGTKPKNDKVTKWLWPTKGRVIKNFSAGDQGNKGIDIAGQRGQSIVSTAGGTVVYSGNALRGYGNLVIVKHNDNYLSAYAHNDRLLVHEGQSVKAGQKIATMGSSGSNSVRLHFEIRYQGKSVNPKRYLP